MPFNAHIPFSRCNDNGLCISFLNQRGVLAGFAVGVAVDGISFIKRSPYDSCLIAQRLHP
jgi:hypothetical protein